MGQEQELRGEKADKGCSDEDQRHVEAKKQALLQNLDESIFLTVMSISNLCATQIFCATGATTSLRVPLSNDVPKIL